MQLPWDGIVSVSRFHVVKERAVLGLVDVQELQVQLGSDESRVSDNFENPVTTSVGEGDRQSVSDMMIRNFSVA